MEESNSSARVSVHHALGGGTVADVLLWRKQHVGVIVLVSATVSWFLFEIVGYNLLSLLANALLLLVVILFLWAKSALLLNRPLPPIPKMEISEESAVKVADALRKVIVWGLSIARDVAIHRDLKRLFQVCFVLWIVSYVSSFFNFLTLVYMAVLLSLSVPVLYEKYQHPIDEKLRIAHRVIQTQYTRLDENVLKKIPAN